MTDKTEPTIEPCPMPGCASSCEPRIEDQSYPNAHWFKCINSYCMFESPCRKTKEEALTVLRELRKLVLFGKVAKKFCENPPKASDYIKMGGDTYCFDVAVQACRDMLKGGE